MNRLKVVYLALREFITNRMCDIILASSENLSWGERIEYMWRAVTSFGPVAIVLTGLGLWFKDNHMFFIFAVFTVLINMWMGVWVHWRNESFEVKVFLMKSIEMATVMLVSYAVLEMILHVAGKENVIIITFEKAIQIATLLYPGGKALKNVYILTEGKYPPKWIMEKLYNLEKNGDLSEFLSTKKTK